MTTIVGNDISSHQGNIDYDTLKKNCNFIFIKSSEGTGFTDPKFLRNRDEARRVGLPLGYYHFARPDLGNTAQAEADWFLQVIGIPQEGEVFCLDYEANWGGDMVTWSKSFLDRLASRTNGCKALVYLNQSLCTSKNWKPVVDAGYGLWIAAYTYDPNNNSFQTGAWSFAAMQQWTSSQQVPGIVGNVDGNVFFGTVATFKKYGYHGVVTPPAAETVTIQKSEYDSLKLEAGKVTGLQGQLIATKETIAQLTDKISKIKMIVG